MHAISKINVKREIMILRKPKLVFPNIMTLNLKKKLFIGIFLKVFN